MSNLQELLNLGLVDIGSDDSRFNKMQSASTALSARFKEEPSLLIPATLISLDEDVDEDDSVFSLVEELVIAEWKTLRNTHVNRPRELLRSIIIDALTAAVNGDHYSAGIAWNSAASLLRHGQVRLGKAASVIEKMLTGARDLAEKEAVLRAGLLSNVPKKRSKKKSPSSEKVKVNISATIKDDDVFADVARSAGPQHPQMKAPLESPNPHWPNSHQAWANEFATRMATALSKAVNLGNARISKSISDQLALYIGEFDKELGEQFRGFEQLESGMLQTYESITMRLNVLWWSEALYSPVLQVGYRELVPPIAAVAAAVDLAKIVPPLAPASVCYILGETLRRLSQLKDGDDKIAVQKYLEGITEAKANFGDHLQSAPKSKRRLPLVDLVGESASGSRISPEAVRKSAGIDPSLVLPPADFAIWVFRGIQANRLVEALR